MIFDLRINDVLILEYTWVSDLADHLSVRASEGKFDCVLVYQIVS